MTDREPESSGSDAGGADDPGTGADQSSSVGGYDRRIEEWLFRLRDEAEQRAPEVLTELAATAKSVAAYLEDAADQVRAKREQAAAKPDSAEDPESGSTELSGPPPPEPPAGSDPG